MLLMVLIVNKLNYSKAICIKYVSVINFRITYKVLSITKPCSVSFAMELRKFIDRSLKNFIIKVFFSEIFDYSFKSAEITFFTI